MYKKSPVTHVKIDGLVVLKIIKHCQEEAYSGNDLVQGVLLGLVENNRLEVTNCFPFPRHSDEEDFDEVQYQLEMMKNLRHVNVDHLHVGWYQSTLFGAYINKPLLDSQFNYQHSIDESIVLVYDHLKTGKNNLSLKALRLTPAMMSLYQDNDFNMEKIKQLGLSFELMFEEVPLYIRNSNLVNLMLCELEEVTTTSNKFNFLDLSNSSYLEKNLRLLIDSVDEMVQDSNKNFNYHRQVAKQAQSKQQYILKRQQENKTRQEHGDLPLADDDINKMFKALPLPPRLDSMLIAGQINTYANQITNFANHNFGKLLVVDKLHESEEAAAI